MVDYERVTQRANRGVHREEEHTIVSTCQSVCLLLRCCQPPKEKAAFTGSLSVVDNQIEQ
jgi:hypothetical protein